MTDGKALGELDRFGGTATKIQGAVAAGVDWVQLREKDLSGGDLLSLARSAVRRAAESPSAKTRVIVNDRLDVALAAGAAGVHLGGESFPPRDVIPWCRNGNAPSEFMIGVSCHDLAGARDAESAGASYIFFGPVFDTPAKRKFGQPQGLAKLGDICRAVRIHVIAIGGVDQTNAPECFRAGAHGIAAIRLFQKENGLEELKRMVTRLREV